MLILDGDPLHEQVGATAPITTDYLPDPAPTPVPGIPGDYGSAGNAATGNTNYILIPPGGRWTAGLTTADEPTYGQFGWVPTSFGLPTDGSDARGWLEDGNGEIVCTWPVGFETARWWYTTNSTEPGFGCELQESTSYTMIIEVCSAGRLEEVCYGKEPGTQETPLYVSGVVSVKIGGSNE